MQKFNKGDRLRGLDCYANHEMWGDLTYVALSDDGRVHLCTSNLLDRDVKSGFADDEVAPWVEPIGFEVGDEATYLFDGERPYRSGKIVEVNDKCVHFEFDEGDGKIGRVPFNFDGTGICRSTFPTSPGTRYRYIFPATLTDGTDEGATLRLDKKAEKEDSLTPEQVLAAELRTLLTRADEIEKELATYGYDVRFDNLTLENFENDQSFRFMPVTIERENTTYDYI